MLSTLLRNKYYLIYAFSLFLSANPYFCWGTNISMLCILLCSILSFLNIKLSYLSLLYLPIYLYLFYRLSEFPLGVRIIRFLPILILFTSRKFLSCVTFYYKRILALFLVPSLIVYILLLCGIDLKHEAISPLNMLKDYNYLRYPFLVVPNILHISSLRFCGYFDEPGVIGTFCIILLYLDNYNLRKWYNLVFFISGIFSYSLFFFLLSFIYIFTSKIRYFFLISLFLFAASYTLKDTEIVQALLLNRLEVKDGVISGNNRESDSFQKFYQNFKNTPEYYWGLGGGTSATTYNIGGASYKDLIVDYGLLFYLFFLLFYLVQIVCLKQKNRYKILSAILLLSTIYQRPFILDFIYVYLIFLPFYSIVQDVDN